MTDEPNSAELQELRADALRWRYVRDNLTSSHSLHMDGTANYRIRSPFTRGRTIAEVIDKLIAEEACGQESRLHSATESVREMVAIEDEFRMNAPDECPQCGEVILGYHRCLGLAGEESTP
jgi:hypothetical protein